MSIFFKLTLEHVCRGTLRDQSVRNGQTEASGLEMFRDRPTVPNKASLRCAARRVAASALSPRLPAPLPLLSPTQFSALQEQ